MTKDKYLNPNTDMMEIYYFYYKLKKKVNETLSLEGFRYAFSLYMFNVVGIINMSGIQYKVLKELNQYFKI